MCGKGEARKNTGEKDNPSLRTGERRGKEEDRIRLTWIGLCLFKIFDVFKRKKAMVMANAYVHFKFPTNSPLSQC